MGDDDLLGLALALTAARRRIVVLDADQNLLALVREMAPQGSIELVQHDLRSELPGEMRGQLDEVFTDPPYTLAGQLLFIRRSLAALRRRTGASLYVCASRAYLSDAQLNSVRGFLRVAGFDLVSTYRGLNRYKAPMDVRVDLKARGWQRTAWLDSDLFHYVRNRVTNVPEIPIECRLDIYDYSSPSGV